MSQAPVMSLTDEMLEEIKEECDSCIEVRLLGRTGALLVEELRRLRAENAELAKDSGRLDLLDSLCEAYGFEGIHDGNRWMIDGPFRNVRDAIDAMESAQ